MVKKNHLLPLSIGGFLFVIDQGAKFLAYHYQSVQWYLVHPWLGWEYFANPGIAFSVPFPTPVLIIGTPLLLIGLLVYLSKKRPLTRRHFLGASLIFFGGLSNLVDRALLGITIDYIRIITAVINIADCMIVVGTLWLILEPRHRAADLDKIEHS